jgi:hypothetical protein
VWTVSKHSGNLREIFISGFESLLMVCPSCPMKYIVTITYSYPQLPYISELLLPPWSLMQGRSFGRVCHICLTPSYMALVLMVSPFSRKHMPNLSFPENINWEQFSKWKNHLAF